MGSTHVTAHPSILSQGQHHRSVKGLGFTGFCSINAGLILQRAALECGRL
jgi:hypothetical protein